MQDEELTYLRAEFDRLRRGTYVSFDRNLNRVSAPDEREFGKISRYLLILTKNLLNLIVKKMNKLYELIIKCARDLRKKVTSTFYLFISSKLKRHLTKP
jgi:hypothetical protein